MQNYLLALIAGWFSGMLTNYLADVLPTYRTLTFPRCLNCKSKTPWRNYLFWPRKCQICKKNRKFRTYVVELVFMLLSIFLLDYHPVNLGFFSSLTVFVYLGVVTIIDIEHRLILHLVSIFGFFLGLIFGIQMHGLSNTLIGGTVGYTSMLGFYFLGIGFVYLSSRIRGPIDEIALGFGDVNLSGIIGLLLGWPGIGAGLIFTLLFSGIASMVYIITMVLRRKYRPDLAMPFGPFLVGGAVFLLFFKHVIYELWQLL